MKKLIFVLALISVACLNSGYIFGEENNVNKPNKSALKYYEFEELTIKVKIQEPEVLFILDKPNITVEQFEQNINFLEKIEEPILEDDLF